MTPVDASFGVARRPREVTLALFRLLEGTPRADWQHWLAARGQAMVRSDLCPCCTGRVATRTAVAAALRRAPERHTVWVELGAADHAIEAARALAAGLTGARVATRFVLVAGDTARDTGTIARDTGTIARDTGNIARGTGTIARGTGTIARGTGTIARGTGTIARDTGTIARASGTTLVRPASADGAPDWELLVLARADRPPAGAGRPVDP